MFVRPYPLSRRTSAAPAAVEKSGGTQSESAGARYLWQSFSPGIAWATKLSITGELKLRKPRARPLHPRAGNISRPWRDFKIAATKRM